MKRYLLLFKNQLLWAIVQTHDSPSESENADQSNEATACQQHCRRSPASDFAKLFH